MIDSNFVPVHLPLPEANVGGWVPYPLFSGATRSLPFMGCHVSVLSPGFCPHPPHAHAEEEILIVLAGSAEIVIAAGPDDPHPRTETMQRGMFSYYPAWQHHTLINNSSSPTTYLMFKWCNDPSHARGLEAQVFDYREQLSAIDEKPFSPRVVLEASTGWLKRLHCHVTHLVSDAGYVAHADPYDVAVLMLAGRVEINSRVLEPHGIAYFSAGELHDIQNVGRQSAQYLVFEFEALAP